MNEKVTDISEALLTMTEEMRLMRETIDSQHAEICNLNRNTEALHQEIRSLKKENETLRERGSNALVYDATVKSLVVYLSVVMFLPYGRIENFFREVFGLDISQGSFVNWVNEAKKNAAPAIENIKKICHQATLSG